jgi:hypothetical protein
MTAVINQAQEYLWNVKNADPAPYTAGGRMAERASPTHQLHSESTLPFSLTAHSRKRAGAPLKVAFNPPGQFMLVFTPYMIQTALWGAAISSTGALFVHRV